MQICNQVGNTLLDCTDHFAEDAALFRRIDLRLIGSGEIDVDDLLLRRLRKPQIARRRLDGVKVDAGLIAALQLRLL